MSTNGAKKAHYDFYEDKQWQGRLPSITRSIESNLKLLRVILLTKGSTIMELGKLLGQGKSWQALGEQKVDKLNNQLAAQVGDHLRPFSNLLTDATPLDPTKQLGGWLGSWGAPDTQPTGKASYNVDNLGAFDYEETQLYNLRMLSLNQKAFVANQLTEAVNGALKDAQTDKNQIAKIHKSFQHIARDTELIQRAIVQRVHEVTDKGTYEPSMQAKALLSMDKLALTALAPFRHLLTTQEKIAPITFFSQETHVQGVPYCDNAVLIGVRYDQVLQELQDNQTGPLPFELLAIPHEVGHYIYSKASVDPRQVDWTSLKDAKTGLANDESAKWQAALNVTQPLTFAKLSATLPVAAKHRAWCEEIFSDICGCIVAGPLAALGLQAMLAARGTEANQVHDGEHPMGVLRPFILSEILNVLNAVWPAKYSFDSAAQGLSENWGNILHQCGYGENWQNIQHQLGERIIYAATKDPAKISLESAPHGTAHDEETINISDELKAIRPLIFVFANLLLHPHLKNSGNPSYTLWSAANDETLSQYRTELENITTWVDTIKSLRPAILPEPSDPKDSSKATIDDLIGDWETKGPVTIGGHH